MVLSARVRTGLEAEVGSREMCGAGVFMPGEAAQALLGAGFASLCITPRCGGGGKGWQAEEKKDTCRRCMAEGERSIGAPRCSLGNAVDAFTCRNLPYEPLSASHGALLRRQSPGEGA